MASATRMPVFKKGFMPNAHRLKLERKKSSDLLQQLDSLVPGKGHIPSNHTLHLYPCYVQDEGTQFGQRVHL